MKFVLLTHAEAADENVMRLVAQYLMSPETGPVFAQVPPCPVGGGIAPAAGSAHVDPLNPVAGATIPGTSVVSPPAPAPEAGPAPTVGLADNPATGSNASALSTAAAAAFGIAPTSSTGPSSESGLPAPTLAPAGAALTGVAEPSNPVAGATSLPAVPGERDADGLPWDERIHAGTKGKTADGKWRRKARTDDAVFNAVVAELKAAAAAPTLPPVPPAAAPTLPTLPPVQMPAAALAAMTPEQAFSQPGLVPPAPPAAGDALTTFEGLTFSKLMEHVSRALERQFVQPTDMQDVCTELSLPNPMMLSTRPDLVPHFGQRLAARLAARGGYL